MKTIKVKLLLIISVFALIVNCDNDDSISVDSIPEVQTLEREISSLPGQTFTFTGVVSDPAGIQSVNIKYEPWFLDKTIVKDSLPESYNLSYKFKVPEDEQENSVHTIPITFTNVGGKSTVENVVITLDQDIASPEIQITSPINGATILIGSGNEVDFNITVTDAELAEFKIESSILTEVFAVTGTSYTYTNSINVDTAGNYSFKVTATDVSGNEASQTVNVNILNELLFDVMYVTDVADNAGLVSDIFGVPYTTTASSEIGEDGYVFTARFYAPTANTEVRFIPQKESFEPYAFGADPNVSGKLVLGTDATVSPIVLPNMGYYEITMDLRDQTYIVTPYSPNDTAFDQVYIIGTGIFVGDTSTCTSNIDGSLMCWNFRSGKPFTQDSNNPYLWTIDVTIDDEPNNDGNNGFILNANPDGWSPFWRIDDPTSPQSTVPNGGTNYIFPDSALGKDYTFVFDTHLNRISAISR
ncbi:hypothetical protein CLV33_10588 [Jejuia pallidilutea]|uniref:Cadherin domain-containing protein n=1 Tax=Jejuia pallidilutea TaxID=504487 RepID=A0A362WZ88_9FLAO|nr:hypothetical protein [Jejuia pallidilutea]PQV48238.1 hypothetical protein CLV33_10588 [Jejuia pallidilutea]